MSETANCEYETMIEDTGPNGSDSGEWSCSHPQHDHSNNCIFHMSAEERREHNISEEEIVDQIFAQLKKEGKESRQFVGANVPELNLDYRDINGVNQYPVDFRYADIDGISVNSAEFEEELMLDHATVGYFIGENCTFEDGLSCNFATFTGPVTLTECDLFFEIIFEDAKFQDSVCFDESEFNNDTNFDRAVFEADVSIQAARFKGLSNTVGDNATFENADFSGATTFQHSTFGCVSFANVSFEDINFSKTTFNGEALFTDTTFNGETELPEMTFNDDASFANVTFHNDVMFSGAQFNGGADVLAEDGDFTDVTFKGSVTFNNSSFGNVVFSRATFEGNTNFENSTFNEVAEFNNCSFLDEADFDEVIFNDDCHFTESVFDGKAYFRGSEFHGGTDHLEDDAKFDNVIFNNEAHFENSIIATGNFVGTKFVKNGQFKDAEIEELKLQAVSVVEDTYIDFTEATIRDGWISQPEDGWIRFDLTQATLGEVNLKSENPKDQRELLDYFRFCETEFEGFKFSDQTGYLDRNNWNLHSFDLGELSDYRPAVAMSPDVIERTYLNAKTSASGNGNNKAAGEFRVKRQQHARQKFYKIATDSAETIGSRFRNFLRASENLFLGITCGHGLRLYRIGGVFLLFPLLASLLFTFGGPAFTTNGTNQLTSIAQLASWGGLETLGMNGYFSYITFLTIGYGNIGPTGVGARMLSAFLVYGNVVLGGLFFYALIKRSEI